MTVHFIGAGPGAADLLTLRGRRLIESCPVCFYAGSLVPQELLAFAPAGARCIDSSGMNLDAIIAEMIVLHERGLDIARLHSGDPSIYGAIAEQMRRLAAAGIPYDITPGVSAYAAAAAALGIELTVPGGTQTVILTRTAMKATPVPETETLNALAATRAALAIHLSIRNLVAIEKVLTTHYGGDAAVIIAYRVSYPDEHFIHTTVETMRGAVLRAKITRTALIMIGGGVARAHDDAAAGTSALYDPARRHLFRPRG